MSAASSSCIDVNFLICLRYRLVIYCKVANFVQNITHIYSRNWTKFGNCTFLLSPLLKYYQIQQEPDNFIKTNQIECQKRHLQDYNQSSFQSCLYYYSQIPLTNTPGNVRVSATLAFPSHTKSATHVPFSHECDNDKIENTPCCTSCYCGFPWLARRCAW